MRTATPHISRFNDSGTLPKPDGHLTFSSKSSKTTAEIQFAQTGRVWIAEYRFRFKCGGFHGRTLPLSVHSKGKSSLGEALADAASRMLADAETRCGDEAMLNATQRNELADLRAWAKAQIEKQLKPLSGISFLDVFAGVGGFHQAMVSGVGASCAGAVEIDPAARETYHANYGTGFPFFDDVRKVDAEALPDFDAIFGGFPCQSFSIAGDGEGYQASGKGGLFFELLRIAKAKRPKQIVLENVPAFATHDGGLTCDSP